MGILDNKVEVITGGSRGIGRVAAELFAREGAALALCGRTQKTLEEARRELRDRHGARVFVQTADIMSRESVEQFVRAAGDEFGRIDILVNNAGESSQRAVDGVNWPVNAVDSVGQKLPGGRFEKISDDEWRDALEQKLLGMIRVTRAALPLLKAAGGASVINVTSIKGRQPPPRVVTSGVAWVAAMNFSKSLSMELAGDGVRVNVVSVGGILTSQMEAGRQKWAPEKTLEEFLAPRAANVPLKRLGTVEEVAQAILFFASPLSGYITGQCLAIDGGGLRMI